MANQPRHSSLARLISCLVALNFGGNACSETDMPKHRLAVMAFANYSENFEAYEVVMPLVIDMARKQFGGVFTPSDLRPVLRQYRIRATGMIGPIAADRIKSALGVDFLLVGSIDYFKPDKALEVGLSLRVIDLSTMSILMAQSRSATSLEFQKVFGFGKVTQIDLLAAKVVEELFEGLAAEQLDSTVTKRAQSVTIAIVEPDNSSRYREAGKITTSHLLTELLERGYRVLEPGLVAEFFASRFMRPRGAIDLSSMKELSRLHQVKLIMTGLVIKHRLARDNHADATSEAELDLRILNASDSNILFMTDIYKNSSSTETLFKLGRCYSLGQLSQKIVAEALDNFFEEKGYAYSLR